MANADKVLSLYETDARVIIRGKAGASVEFGNTLLLAEQAEGLIVDWQLHREGVRRPRDNCRSVWCGWKRPTAQE